MNTKGVEDGIVCEFCGTHCYQGAEHNARVEDNARFDDPKPAAVPVEERTAEEVTEEDDAYGIPEDRQCVCWGTPGCEVCGGSGDLAEANPIPEERTAEMEPSMSTGDAADRAAYNAGLTAAAKLLHKDWKDKEARQILDLKIPEPLAQPSPEMEQMMGRLRKSAEAAESMRSGNTSNPYFGHWNQGVWDDFNNAASPEKILRILDHIEGTAK